MEKIRDELSIRGLAIEGGEGACTLTVDARRLDTFIAWAGRDISAASALLGECGGVWRKEEWLLALIGLKLGIINRVEARSIARSWACEDAPDECVLPTFLLRDE